MMRMKAVLVAILVTVATVSSGSILDSGRPITFKCLGHIYNPDHLYLNGLTVSGGVNLVPNTTGGNTGTHWLPIKLADGIYAFKCLGHIYTPKHLYLNGLTGNGSVSLAPSTHGQYTGTHWQAYMLADGSYSFKCLGHIYNPNNLYLDGLTASGGVSLAPSVSGGFTGTHWRIGPMTVAGFPIVAVIVPPLVVASGAVVIITFVILLILLRHRKCLERSDRPLRFSRLMSQTSYTSEQQQTPTDGKGRAIGTGQEQSHGEHGGE